MTAYLKWLRDGGTYEMDEEQTLLHGLLENGVDVPFHCMFGHCGTCAVRLVEGEVEHDPVPGLTGEERKGSRILLCSSRPKTKRLVLDIILPQERSEFSES